MYMEIAVYVSVTYLRRIYSLEPILGGDCGGDMVVQPLERIAHVAVLVYTPVRAVQVAFDQLEPFRQQALPFPYLPVLLAVEDEGLCYLRVSALDEHFLDKVLHVFNR